MAPLRSRARARDARARQARPPSLEAPTRGAAEGRALLSRGWGPARSERGSRPPGRAKDQAGGLRPRRTPLDPLTRGGPMAPLRSRARARDARARQARRPSLEAPTRGPAEGARGSVIVKKRISAPHCRVANGCGAGWDASVRRRESDPGRADFPRLSYNQSSIPQSSISNHSSVRRSANLQARTLQPGHRHPSLCQGGGAGRPITGIT
jgi:hypothetical protein